MQDLLLEQEARRFRAVVEGDTATLDQLMHPDLIYGHTSGNVETKAKFIDALASGNRKYSQFDRLESQVRVVGDAAFIHGTAKCVLVSKGVNKDFTIRYLSALVRENSVWRLTNWQSTIIPAQ